MKLSLLQENLLAALNLVYPAVATRSTLPVLSNICFEATPAGLRLSAMNMEIALSVTLPAHIEQHGSVTLPAHLLLDLIKAFPATRIDWDLNPRTQTVTLTCGHNTAKVKGIDASEFPPVPDLNTAVTTSPGAQVIELPPAVLRRLINQTAFAAAGDESRPILQAIHTTLAGERLTLTAVDGYRLATASADIPENAVAAFVANIPATAYQRLAALINHLKLDDDANIVLAYIPERNQLLARLGNAEMVAQTIEGNYPDYRKIIPAETGAMVATANLADLLKTLFIANLFADKPANTVRLAITPGDPATLTITAASSATGDMKSPLDIIFAGATGIVMSFNSRLLRQGLASFDAPVITFALTQPERPILLRTPDDPDPAHFYVLMPLSVQ